MRVLRGTAWIFSQKSSSVRNWPHSNGICKVKVADCILIVELEQARVQNVDRAVAALYPRTLVDGLLIGGCDFAQKFSHAWFASLVKAELMPPRTASLHELHIRVHILGSQVLPRNTCTEHHSVCAYSGSIQKPVVKDVTSIFHAVEGLCLDCMKKEATGNRDIVCRESHN